MTGWARSRRGGFVELDQVGVELLDLAAQPLVARDQIVGVFARQVKVRIVHLGRNGRAFLFFLFDLGFDLPALLRDSVPFARCVAIVFRRWSRLWSFRLFRLWRGPVVAASIAQLDGRRARSLR